MHAPKAVPLPAKGMNHELLKGVDVLSVGMVVIQCCDVWITGGIGVKKNNRGFDRAFRVCFMLISLVQPLEIDTKNGHCKCRVGDFCFRSGVSFVRHNGSSHPLS